MSEEMVSIRMIVDKNQFCAVYNSVGLIASADKHRYYTLGKQMATESMRSTS